MFIIDIELEDLIKEIPIVGNWINSLQTHILNGDTTTKVESQCAYGFFIPKSMNNMESYQSMADRMLKMKYPERLDLELSKVRVDVSIKIGNMIFTNRLPKGQIPSYLHKLVSEITKVKMMVEAEIFGNQDVDVYTSIPPLDNDIHIEVIKPALSHEYQSEVDFDIDDILDKISQGGMDSLTDEEREFLDKKSKDL